MDIEDMEVVQIELKYCERCGGLWFRRSGSAEIYCAPCALALGELMPNRIRRRPKLPVNDSKKLQAFGETFVVYSEGGNA
jgi:hypothetical protein